MTYTDTNRKNDFQWFWDNYDILFNQYGHKVLAIQNKQILGVYSNKNDAIDITAQTYELGTFIVQECSQDKSQHIGYIASWELVR